MRPATTAVVAALLVGVARADGPAEQAYPIAAAGSLVIRLPDRWRDVSIVADAGGRAPSMLEFLAKDPAGKMQLKLLPIVPPMLRPEMRADDGLRRLCESGARRFVATSVEKKLTIVPLDGLANHGFYYTLTDASRDPGEFRCTSGGAFVIGDAAVVTMTLMHQPNQPALAAALDVIRTASVRAATTAPATRPAGATLSMASPDGAWRVTLPDPGCGAPNATPDGTSIEYAAYGVANVTALFEPAARPNVGAAAVRAFYLSRMKRNGASPDRVTLGGDDRVALLRYTMYGRPNAHAYLARGGVWLDVHLSCDPGDASSIGRIEDALANLKVDAVKP